jgi:hypothetical protein
MISLKLPLWLRFVLLAGVIALASGASLLAYRHYTRPVTLSVAVGSRRRRPCRRWPAGWFRPTRRCGWRRIGGLRQRIDLDPLAVCDRFGGVGSTVAFQVRAQLDEELNAFQIGRASSQHDAGWLPDDAATSRCRDP